MIRNVHRWWSVCLLVLLAAAFALPAAAQEKKAKKKREKSPLQRPDVPAGAETVEPTATPPERIHLPKDFKVELIFNVPKEKLGSWVAMCVDPKGRLITSDQYGSLYRVTPPPLGGSPGETRVEKIDLPIGHAQGLVYGFDSLYVMVNEDNVYQGRGLYRVRDTDGDDKYDKVDYLRKFVKGNEHGVHGLLLSPDGKSLFVVQGDQTDMTQLASSRVPQIWSEDHLLPRMPDGRGFMKDTLAPGGCIYKTDPDGKNFELWCNGFRNEYDAAFDRHGDLFTYDADMEWDMNTPWYRPTRICLCTSGAEFGWRNGTGKWPPYYADSVPPVIDIGPGSPTGVCFGYGAKFPAKYQEAFFACDWSYGKLYAIHLTPDGSSYKAEKEEFMNGTPLPLTDILINPTDQAMYFTTGGRRTQSGLYRLTYTGSESTAPSKGDDSFEDQRALRRKLEAFHGKQDPRAITTAWPYLSSADRFLRFAARVAVEHQPVSQWRDKALKEKDPEAAIQALIALIRCSARDQFHWKPSDPPLDPALKGKVLAALEKIDWEKLSDPQRLELIRAYGLTFIRLGPPAPGEAVAVIERFDPKYPAHTRELNSMLSELLIYLQSPTAATKTMALLAQAPSQQEQLDYAKSLRMLKVGWTMDQRKQYMEWFLKAMNYRGGASFGLFIEHIKTEAVAALPDDARKQLKSIIEAKPEKISPQQTYAKMLEGRSVVKQWTVDELAPLVEKGLKGGRDFDHGKRLFGAVGCFACHRFDNDGGAIGPDLTGVGGRFSPRDLLESIVEPSKVISDQYQQTVITTTTGDVVVGRIANLSGDTYQVMTNMYEPDHFTGVNARIVKSIKPSKLSPMPEGLLNVLHESEILDLTAYLLSGGDKSNKMFASAQP